MDRGASGQVRSPADAMEVLRCRLRSGACSRSRCGALAPPDLEPACISGALRFRWPGGGSGWRARWSGPVRPCTGARRRPAASSRPPGAERSRSWGRPSISWADPGDPRGPLSAWDGSPSSASCRTPRRLRALRRAGQPASEDLGEAPEAVFTPSSTRCRWRRRARPGSGGAAGRRHGGGAQGAAAGDTPGDRGRPAPARPASPRS